MGRSRKKHTAYRKVCGIIGQPVAEFTDHIRQLMGENADTTARVITFNPKTNQSHIVTVAAAAADGGDRAGGGEEYLLTLTENRGYVHGGAEGSAAAAAAAAGTPDGGQAAKGKKRTLFKGRVQLSPSQSAPRGGGGGGGRGRGRRPSAGRPRRQARTSPGLSSIAGVCMLCAVAAAGGIAFYASYMSQTADHGTINVIRAEVIDLDESHGGRLVDVELFASHTSCVMMYDSILHTVLYEEGGGCDDDTWRDPPPEADSYTTSTGVHVTLDDYRMQADDRKWMMLEIHTDTASIVHPVKVEGVR